MSKNYYDILGVAKTASQDEISKAYKKIAMQSHPDRFQDKVEKEKAQKKFQEINEAYNTLKDVDKRKAYDMGGSNPFGGGNPFGEGGPFGGRNPFGDFSGFSGGGASGDFFEDIFDFMSGGGRRRGAKQDRGNDLEYALTITVLEAFQGVKKQVDYNCPVKCGTCAGSGSKDKKMSTCNKCDGQGVITQRQGGIFMVQQTCPYCKGTGETIANACSDCKGYGVKDGKRSIIVNIKPGAYSGMKIHYEGYGEDVPRDGRAGSLIVAVTIKDDKVFKLDKDNNLCIDLDVSFITAILGGTIEYMNIDNEKILVDIPKGCQHDTKLRFGKKGMPILNKSDRTDLIMKCKIVLPGRVNEHQKKLLRDLHASFSNEEDAAKGFFSTLKEKLFG